MVGGLIYSMRNWLIHIDHFSAIFQKIKKKSQWSRAFFLPELGLIYNGGTERTHAVYNKLRLSHFLLSFSLSALHMRRH